MILKRKHFAGTKKLYQDQTNRRIGHLNHFPKHPGSRESLVPIHT